MEHRSTAYVGYRTIPIDIASPLILADRANGRAYATVLRLSAVCRRLSVTLCSLLWLNGAS